LKTAGFSLVQKTSLVCFIQARHHAHPFHEDGSAEEGRYNKAAVGEPCPRVNTQVRGEEE